MMATKKRNSKVTSSKRMMPKKVNFTMVVPEAQNVFLVGDFNGWNIESHPLKKDSKETWKISINLVPGRYEYRFIVDGQWEEDPNCTTFIPNSYGSENCILIMKEV
jgi:1,4-alpha-glucan branching enzyme